MKLADKAVNARPLFVALCEDGYVESSEQQGMTLLEYYVGLAMQGLIAFDEYDSTPEGLAQDAVKCAKALIAELEKQ